MQQFLDSLGLGGPALKQAIIALGVVVGLMVLLRIVKAVVHRRIESWVLNRPSVDQEYLTNTLSSGYWFFNLVVLHVGYHLAPLGRAATKYGDYAFSVFYAFLAISLFSNILKLSLDLALRHKGSSLMEYRGRVLLPVITGVAWIIALAFILENMGVQISTILAGLGVAGVAVGFAAQAVLGDLFSYFAILFDRPFRIGDFIVLSAEVRGNIEHIGLKTSRIRSLDGEQIIMSNSDLTNSRVKNYRRMVRRRIMFQFGLLYSTPADTLERIPSIVKTIIEQTPLATFDRAHFLNFGDSSLNFEVVYYVEAPDYNVYMDTQQAINLALVRAMERENVSFAFPTRTIHLEQETPA